MEQLTKEEFTLQLEQAHITTTLENMEWNDVIVYYWSAFETWLQMHEVSEKDIATIQDNMNMNDLIIYAEYAGGFPPADDNQFTLLIEQEFEDTLGEWFTEQERKWIEEEYVVEEGLFYIYNPTRYFITIDTIREWLQENNEL